MRREIIVAIILGFFLGLVITGGIWWTNNRHSFHLKPVAPTPSSSISPSPLPSGSSEKENAIMLPLSVISPQDGEILDKEKVEVKGKTLPGAVVVLIYPEGESIVEADKDGEFTSQVELKGGANEIKIAAYDDQGHKKEIIRTIVYSTSKI